MFNYLCFKCIVLLKKPVYSGKVNGIITYDQLIISYVMNPDYRFFYWQKPGQPASADAHIFVSTGSCTFVPKTLKNYIILSQGI